MFDSPAGMSDLLAAIDTFTRISIAHFELDSGLKYHGDLGPVYITTIGGIRIRGIFTDPAGVPYCDARLVAESAYLGTDAWRYYGDEVGGLIHSDTVHSFWIADRDRGLHDALVVPVGIAADQLDLGEVETFPQVWCRSWATVATVTDASEVDLRAAGWGEHTTI